jgi:hypothetical protein
MAQIITGHRRDQQPGSRGLTDGFWVRRRPMVDAAIVVRDLFARQFGNSLLDFLYELFIREFCDDSCAVVPHFIEDAYRVFVDLNKQILPVGRIPR